MLSNTNYKNLEVTGTRNDVGLRYIFDAKRTQKGSDGTPVDVLYSGTLNVSVLNVKAYDVATQQTVNGPAYCYLNTDFYTDQKVFELHTQENAWRFSSPLRG